MKDYYKILELEKTATQDDVKKSYRRLAMKYHPDRNSGDAAAEKKFKEISEANEILSDPDKRKEYDGGGATGFGNMYSHWRNANPEEHFRKWAERTGAIPRQHVGRHIKTSVDISFLESIKGCKKDIKVQKYQYCEKCKGVGAESFKNCSVCQGTGMRTVRQGSFVISQTCDHCGGVGQIPDVDCTACQGNGYTNSVEETISLDIPAGVQDGMRMNVGGGGENGGNLYVLINVENDPYLVREGNDLGCRVPLSYTQFLLGCKAEVRGVDQVYKFDVPPATQPGATFRLQGLGVPDVRNPRHVGDLIILTELAMPVTLPNDYKKIVKKLADMEEKHKTPEQKEHEARTST